MASDEIFLSIEISFYAWCDDEKSEICRWLSYFYLTAYEKTKSIGQR